MYFDYVEECCVFAPPGFGTHHVLLEDLPTGLDSDKKLRQL